MDGQKNHGRCAPEEPGGQAFSPEATLAWIIDFKFTVSPSAIDVKQPTPESERMHLLAMTVRSTTARKQSSPKLRASDWTATCAGQSQSKTQRSGFSTREPEWITHTLHDARSNCGKALATKVNIPIDWFVTNAPKCRISEFQNFRIYLW